MKLRKGDTVLITSGKDRGRKGKILKVFPKKNRILVEGINLRKKHQKPKRTGEKGQMVTLPAPIGISNAKLICPKCGKAARVGYRIVDDKKYRVCKKCSQEI